MKPTMLLVADIGGTHSRFALFSAEQQPGGVILSQVPDSELILKTGDYNSFADLLSALRVIKAPSGFTLAGDYTPLAACLAIPAAVTSKNQKVSFHAPNIAWPLSCADFLAVSDIPVTLINDFAAQGLAALFPEILGLASVLPGSAKPEPSSAEATAALRVMIGAGTGLGKAIILPQEKSPDNVLPSNKNCCGLKGALFIPDGQVQASRILPSEGGHSLFPFQGREEAAFQEFLQRISKRREVIGDMVVTGVGLSALFAFHNGDNFLLPSPEIAAKIRAAGHKITSPEFSCSPLAKSLEWLARFYGRACRNFVLELLPFGGLYLSGGMLSHVPALLGHQAFVAEFRGSETQGELLGYVPVSWVSNQDAGLWGAAMYALRLLHQ